MTRRHTVVAVAAVDDAAVVVGRHSSAYGCQEHDDYFSSNSSKYSCGGANQSANQKSEPHWLDSALCYPKPPNRARAVRFIQSPRNSPCIGANSPINPPKATHNDVFSAPMHTETLRTGERHKT
jgi:hypothetical protein